MAVGLSSIWDQVSRMLLFDWAMSGWDMELASKCMCHQGGDADLGLYQAAGVCCAAAWVGAMRRLACFRSASFPSSCAARPALLQWGAAFMVLRCCVGCRHAVDGRCFAIELALPHRSCANGHPRMSWLCPAVVKAPPSTRESLGAENVHAVRARLSLLILLLP